MAARKKRKIRTKREARKIPKRKRKKSLLRKITKWHSFLTIAILGLYLGLGFWLGPGALKQDIEGKVAGATTFLSVHIAGPPAKPLNSDSSGCSGANPYVYLDWSATNDTDNYDVYRNGALLISGITNTHYRDESVALGTSYDYYVVANGPLGSTQSDTVSITTPSECYTPPPPPPEEVTCRITTLDKIDLTNFRCLPKTKKKRPVFSGTANVSNARIQAEISPGSGKRKVISSFSANENGYWSWGVQNQLKKGTKIIYVKATDPNDSSRYGTCSLRFKVSKKGYSKKEMKKCTGANSLKKTFLPMGFAFSPGIDLKIRNENESAFPGENLDFDLATGDSESKLNVNYKVYASNDNLVFSSPEGKIGRQTAKSLTLPSYLNSGEYKLIANATSIDEDISAERGFEIKERPLVVIGNNFSLTVTEIFSNLGWIVIVMLLILAGFGWLLFLEYLLSRRAAIQITESELKRKGMID